jgi:hypothetical protein
MTHQSPRPLQRICYRVHYNALLLRLLQRTVTTFTYNAHCLDLCLDLYTHMATASAMAAESDPAVTRVTVVLNTPDD